MGTPQHQGETAFSSLCVGAGRLVASHFVVAVADAQACSPLTLSDPEP